VSEPLSPERETSPNSTNSKLLEEIMEGEGRVDNPKNNDVNNELETFGFPICDITRNVTMKNILLLSLAHFNGMSSEGPD